MKEEGLLARAGEATKMEKSLARLADKQNKPARDLEKAYGLALDLGCMEQCGTRRGTAAHDGGVWMPAERIGWNAWRHTFATLRAQAGVTLDKIADWMGNTLTVCKKHYTQFMPRGAHEEDIDKE